MKSVCRNRRRHRRAAQADTAGVVVEAWGDAAKLLINGGKGRRDMCGFSCGGDEKGVGRSRCFVAGEHAVCTAL